MKINNPVKEIIEHFKEEVSKRDQEIERLKAELEEKGKKAEPKDQNSTKEIEA